MDITFEKIELKHNDKVINTLVDELNKRMEQLNFMKDYIERNTVESKKTVIQNIVQRGGSGYIPAEVVDRTRVIVDVPVVTTGTQITFLTDAHPAQNYPHNVYDILRPEGGCWKYDTDGVSKIGINCNYSNYLNTGFTATPDSDGFLTVQVELRT